MSAARLDAIQEAVEAFAAELAEDDERYRGIVTQTLVVYEITSVADDGAATYCIRYAVPREGMSMSATLGLAEAGRHYVRRDLLGDEDNE